MDVSMDVLKLLRTKNRCLERFLDISARFEAEVEAGDFSRLERFHQEREAILKGFALYDRKLSECISQLTSADRTPELVSKIEEALQRKQDLVHRILSIDEKLSRKIVEERARLQKEMAQNQKSVSMIKKFKSGWISESVDELDEKL